MAEGRCDGSGEVHMVAQYLRCGGSVLGRSGGSVLGRSGSSVLGRSGGSVFEVR